MQARQFVGLSPILQGGFGRRAYSMANPAEDAGRLEFIVKHKPGGQANDMIFEDLRAVS